ncbi:pentatricopeptide repeat-containing protein [Cucumis melo var. makuwa]|uniref:Pentatricopeptide repeat-containing protein n=2 Tax=Cucumis melo TaxID=3656 RepID=A0A5A7UQW1_CUCMM|nr:pentatricopeptide repeat-containing protein [Cucumis melo var. makuwa]
MKNGRFTSVTHRVFSSLSDYVPSFAPIQTSNQTSTSLSSALQHYINSDDPSHGLKIHAHILKTGFIPNTNISIKLLILHLKCKSLKFARQVFDALPQKTLSAYNYMIGGYIKMGKVPESLPLVRELIFSGEKPDGFTFSMLLKASTLAHEDFLPHSLGRVVHAQILKSNVPPDDVLYTALIDSCIKNGDIYFARMVFDLMLKKNVICSTSMISGYMNQGLVNDAEEIFSKTVEKDIVVFNAMIEGYSKTHEHARKSFEVYIDMQRLCFSPNISTFSSVIGACSVLAALEAGQQIQCQLMKTKFFTDIRMGSALIDMYSKCGRTDDARQVFDQMRERNVFSWTSMIDGYGKNGYPSEALKLFCIMQEKHQIQPNLVTFLSALSACAHGGLVEEGWEIFESMERDYSLKPKMEHYACMVDLLGRAGSLLQAWEFVMQMPETPNSDVWAALLSSAKLHGNVEMACTAANELFKLNANSRPGAYVALSNTFAEAGKWNNVSELREIMKIKRVKCKGSSWFGAGDGSL